MPTTRTWTKTILAIGFLAAIALLCSYQIGCALLNGEIIAVAPRRRAFLEYIPFATHPVGATISLPLHLLCGLSLAALYLLWDGELKFEAWFARGRPNLDTSIRGPRIAGSGKNDPTNPS